MDAAAVALAEQAEEQMLGGDLVGAEAARLVHRRLDRPLRVRFEPDLVRLVACARAELLLRRRADGRQGDAVARQHPRRAAVLDAQQAEQEVDGADRAVVEAGRLFLRVLQDAARVAGEPVEVD